MIKQKIEKFLQFQKFKAFFKKYERILMPGALVFGFIIDVITFSSIDIFTTFIILTLHLVFVSFVVLFINYFDSKLPTISGKFVNYCRLLAPFAMQFSFGALLSATFIFYTFWGVISISWPLLLAILFLMISNEIFRSAYLRPTVQISVLFFVLITFFSLTLPYLFKSISIWIFVLANIFSIVFISLFVFLLIKVSEKIKSSKNTIIMSVGIVFVLISAFYFTNTIPPVPLALKDAGVYYSVERLGQNYAVVREKKAILQKIYPSNIFKINKGDIVYLYTAIFSPSHLDVQIVHDWQKYNETTGEWETKNKIPFNIFGGRKEGFRGYSLSSRVDEGKWRVYVETSRGQVLGKISFSVKEVDTEIETETIFK